MLQVIQVIQVRKKSRTLTCQVIFFDPMDGRAHQAPLSMGFFFFQARIVEWIAISSPGDLPDPGIKPESPALQADSLPLSHGGNPLSDHFIHRHMHTGIACCIMHVYLCLYVFLCFLEADQI